MKDLATTPHLETRATDVNSDATGRECRLFDAVPSSARAARQFVAESLRYHGAPLAVIGDYSLVVSELVTNVIEHSEGAQVEIVLGVSDPEWWELQVAGGRPVVPKRMLAPELWTVAGAHEVSGRGLGIVRQLMDDIVTDISPDRVTVLCRRRRDGRGRRSNGW